MTWFDHAAEFEANSRTLYLVGEVFAAHQVSGIDSLEWRTAYIALARHANWNVGHIASLLESRKAAPSAQASGELEYLSWIEALRPVKRWPLDMAQRCGAKLTGEPNGTEPITVVFSIRAWQAFSRELDRRG